MRSDPSFSIGALALNEIFGYYGKCLQREVVNLTVIPTLISKSILLILGLSPESRRNRLSRECQNIVVMQNIPMQEY